MTTIQVGRVYRITEPLPNGEYHTYNVLVLQQESPTSYRVSDGYAGEDVRPFTDLQPVPMWEKYWREREADGHSQ